MKRPICSSPTRVITADFSPRRAGPARRYSSGEPPICWRTSPYPRTPADLHAVKIDRTAANGDNVQCLAHLFPFDLARVGAVRSCAPAPARAHPIRPIRASGQRGADMVHAFAQRPRDCRDRVPVAQRVQSAERSGIATPPRPGSVRCFPAGRPRRPAPDARPACRPPPPPDRSRPRYVRARSGSDEQISPAR